MNGGGRGLQIQKGFFDRFIRYGVISVNAHLWRGRQGVVLNDLINGSGWAFKVAIIESCA